jgi:Sec-independent protein translocase protein TatA
VGFGTELLIALLLGFLILGPRRMHIMLGQVARVKADFDKMTRSLKSQLATESAPPVTSPRAATRELS